MPPKAKKLRPQLRWILLGSAVALTLYVGFHVSSVGQHPSSNRILFNAGGEEDAARTSSVQAEQKPCPTIAPTISTASPVSQFDNPRLYHVVTSAQGFANHWQARIHYWWYKKQRALCRRGPGPCDMGGFTRLLHSGEADDLMDEVPTVVVKPLPPAASNGSNYVVLNRPFAFLSWLKVASIPEKYVLMCEGDHLFMRPLPNLMNGESQGAALFTYIVPQQYPNIIRKFIGNVSDEEIKRVPQIGNSPTFVSVEELRVVAPVWYNTTMEIWNDKEAHDAWNWVLEMYGYSLATYRTGQHRNLKTYTQLLAHPPFDKDLVDYKRDPFYILHLTYPCTYNSTGGFTDKRDEFAWRFDKRDYMSAPPPRNLAPPPANVNSTLVSTIISMINEATAHIPCWDEYVKTSKVVYKCAEVTALNAALTLR